MQVLERAVVLASLVEPEGSRDDVMQRPLGRLAAVLLQLHEQLTGPTLEAIADCAECGTTVEFCLDTAGLVSLADKICDEQAPLAYGRYELSWRVPSTADLLSVAGLDDGADTALLARCVREARCAGRQIRIEEIPGDVIAALSAAIGDADPLAEITSELSCPACNARFDTSIELTSFVWTELDARARQLLIEVDALARAYGWSEADSLRLSDMRRAEYLRLVGDGVL